MALEQLIKRGENEINKKDYLAALATLTSALEESPKAFQAYFKRSIAYQKLNNYDAAKKDISEAIIIAEQRGKRADMGACYFRLGLICYAQNAYDTAFHNFQKAKEYDCQEPTLDLWISKSKHEVSKASKQSNENDVDRSENTKKEEKTPVDHTNIDYLNKTAPLKTKIRDDWYQTADSVIISIYTKLLRESEISIQFDKRAVSLSFPILGGSEYNFTIDPLFSDIDPSQSTYNIYSTKLEVILMKVEQVKWPTLEGGSSNDVILQSLDSSASTDKPASQYPSSSKKKINWDKIDIDDDEGDGNGNEGDFFSKLYKDTDDNTRRAMMKSYVESNGTVLTTNWEEAKSKTYETNPPEGMIAKKWT